MDLKDLTLANIRAQAAAVDAATRVEHLTGVRMPRSDEGQISTVTYSLLGKAAGVLWQQPETPVGKAVVMAVAFAMGAEAALRRYRKEGRTEDAVRVQVFAGEACEWGDEVVFLVGM